MSQTCTCLCASACCLRSAAVLLSCAASVCRLSSVFSCTVRTDQ